LLRAPEHDALVCVKALETVALALVTVGTFAVLHIVRAHPVILIVAGVIAGALAYSIATDDETE
jgi:hypothetical protein